MSPLAESPSLASSLRHASPALGTHIVYEGWVLKKRRKKLQGFARRYFVLHSSGILSYSFGPGQPTRDQLALPHAAISTSAGRKDIHLDSNTTTFHIKCLSSQDFNAWMSAFRKFIALNNEARKSLSIRALSRNASLNVTKSHAIVDEIGMTITQLESAIYSLMQETAATTKRNNVSLKSRHKDHHAKEGHGSVFSMFKKEKEKNGIPPEHDDDSPDPLLSSHERLTGVLDTLKSQHVLLVRFMQTLGPVTAQPQMIPEEPPSPTTLRHTDRASFTTTGSSAGEWYDATDNFSDGPQEFLLDESIEPESNSPSRIVGHISESEDETDEAADTDDEEDVEEPDVHPTTVVRRTQLPAPPSGDEGSLFSILKKNVGKDLATIAVPVTFNEPLTLLQRACEEVEYYDLLTQAAATTDLVERLAHIAAFTVSGYAHTRLRSGRKGFNPMLGETFEDVRMKFIAEKVVHHPLVMAYHAEGPGWDLTCTTAGKTKFWGKSLEIIPIGITRLRIGEDTYEWNQPSSFIRNVMMGTKYLEHVGTMTITSTTDGSKCILEFKQNGYWGSTNAVSGTIHSSQGSVIGQVEGKWDESISQVLGDSHLRVLWRINPFPKNAQEYYGFTSFGITLNEITSDIQAKLPPTDSRLRKDVRALEEGRLDDAEHEKHRIEEMQRNRRKQGRDVQPRWFKKVAEDDWAYVGGYWEARSRDWKDIKIEHLW